MMNQTDRSGEDRRAQSLADIASLEKSRSETLALYSDLAAHRPFGNNSRFLGELKRFCEALIDYTAHAHFRLYHHLSENKERRQPVAAVAEKIYPKIAATTDAILAFNDRYRDEESLSAQLDRVEKDLSELGESLADRIYFEDKVIGAMREERRNG